MGKTAIFLRIENNFGGFVKITPKIDFLPSGIKISNFRLFARFKRCHMCWFRSRIFGAVAILFTLDNVWVVADPTVVVSHSTNQNLWF